MKQTERGGQAEGGGDGGVEAVVDDDVLGAVRRDADEPRARLRQTLRQLAGVGDRRRRGFRGRAARPSMSVPCGVPSSVSN